MINSKIIIIYEYNQYFSYTQFVIIVISYVQRNTFSGVSLLYILWKYYKPSLNITISSVFIPIIVNLAIFIPSGFQYRNNTFIDYLCNQCLGGGA